VNRHEQKYVEDHIQEMGAEQDEQVLKRLKGTTETHRSGKISYSSHNMILTSQTLDSNHKYTQSSNISLAHLL